MDIRNYRRIDAGIKTLAAFGAGGLLGLAVIGAIQVAPLMPEGFSGLAATITSRFFPAERQQSEPLALTLSRDTVVSGEQFTLSFTPTASVNDDAARYTFIYYCRDVVTLNRVTRAGNEPIPCNTDYAFPEGQSHITLAATSDTNVVIPVPLMVHAKPEDAERDEATRVASATVMVYPAGENTADTGNGGAASDSDTGGGTATDNRPVYDGEPDLAASILELGYIENNAFTQNPENRTQARKAVRFAVRNVGGGVSASWYFDARLPTVQPYTFTSRPQQALAPGDRIEFTLGFDRLQSGGGTFRVIVDPQNQIVDENRSNNTVSTFVEN